MSYHGNIGRNEKKSPFVFLKISVTIWLIIVNVAVFILFSLLDAFFGPKIYLYFQLTPLSIIQGEKVWTLFTHMFLHGGIIHLFFNMLSLWFVGRLLEKIVGRKRFVLVYLISGIIAGLFFAFLSGYFGHSVIGERIFGNPNISGVGASGAIFGLVGVLIFLVPFMKVYLIAGPIIAVVLQAIIDPLIKSPALSTALSILINLYIIFSLFTMFSFNPKTRKIILPVEVSFWILPIVAILPLVIIGLIFPLPIANTAHFGGLIAGLIYGYYLKKKYPQKIKMLGRIFR